MSSLYRSAVMAVALLSTGGRAAVADDAGLLPTLTLPDGSTMPLSGLPQRAGPSVPQPSGYPAEQPPDKAGTVDRPVSAAVHRRQRLDDLFARLAGAQDAAESTSLTAAIDNLWLQSGSPTADLLMQRALQAIAAKDDKTAAQLLDKIVDLRPGWAEAWNKRATVRYVEDDDAGSMEDISHVLALEPRHFGALSGMGFIFHRNGDDKAALMVLRKASAINPQQSSIKALIEQLTPTVEGHDL